MQWNKCTHGKCNLSPVKYAHNFFTKNASNLVQMAANDDEECFYTFGLGAKTDSKTGQMQCIKCTHRKRNLGPVEWAHNFFAKNASNLVQMAQRMIRGVFRHLVWAQKLIRKRVRCNALNTPTGNAISIPLNMRTSFSLKMRPTFSNRRQMMTGSAFRHFVWARKLMQNRFGRRICAQLLC